MEMDFRLLLGETLSRIDGAQVGSENIIFTTVNNKRYALYHQQDCCELVDVADVIGDIDDLIGSPLIEAEEVSGGEPDGWTPGEHTDSYTWTFYKLGTAKGFVTIRWYGQSNGYYSESVSFTELLDYSH